MQLHSCAKLQCSRVHIHGNIACMHSCCGVSSDVVLGEAEGLQFQVGWCRCMYVCMSICTHTSHINMYTYLVSHVHIHVHILSHTASICTHTWYTFILAMGLGAPTFGNHGRKFRHWRISVEMWLAWCTDAVVGACLYCMCDGACLGGACLGGACPSACLGARLTGCMSGCMSG